MELESTRRVGKLADACFHSRGESGVMRARAGLIPVAAVSLIALAGGGLSVDSARSEENCLAAPTGKAPEGSHWHYRTTDPATQTKCWYLRTVGETGQQKPATRDKLETAVTAAKPPAATTPKAAPDPTAATVQQPRPDQAARSASGGAQTPHSSSPAPWPAAPQPAGAGGVAWPDPTRLGAGMAAPQPTGAAPQAAGSPAASDQQEPAAPAPDSDQAQPNSAASDSQVAAPVATAAASDTDQMTLGLLLALVVSLLIAGIFVRRIVKTMFARRRLKIAPQRQEPVLNAGIAGEGRAPRHDGLELDWVERLDGDVQAALRDLLRTLERQAA
jgi:hypothetical protein